MPNIKSAMKRVRQATAKQAANRAKTSALRTSIKKTLIAIKDGADNAADLVKVTQKKIDQAKAKGRLHKNTAARRASRLARSLNGLSK